MLTVAERAVQVLQRHGVEHIFGQSLPSELLLAAERAGIRQVFYRTENAGGAMADGFARSSGRVGVVAAQNGPAATLLVPPLAEAYKASVPVVALVQEVPRHQRGRNAFQEFDHHALFASCTKLVVDVDSPERIEDDIERGLAAATSGRPGPVVLLFPRDLLGVRAGTRELRVDSLGEYPLDRPRPAREAVQRAAGLLARAERPLVIAGGGLHLSHAHEALARLQDVASLPAATTTMGKGSIDERHELSIGVIGSFMGETSPTRSAREIVRDADVILLVGSRTNENGTDAWTLIPPQAAVIQLDIAPEEVGRNYDSIRLVGDARAGLEDLAEAMLAGDMSVRIAERPRLVARILEARERDASDAARVTESDRAPLRPERIMRELDRVIDADTIIVADASYSTIWAAAYLRARRAGQRFLSPRGMAGLGWGLPLAIGAQIAHPGRRVVCLTGDGAFAHTWQELETAARERLPITIILLNNGILGYQKHAELHTFGAHTSAIEFAAVEHASIASACGAFALRVDRPDELTEALAQALAHPGPSLLEVATDPAAHPPITAWDGSEALRGAAEPVNV